MTTTTNPYEQAAEQVADIKGWICKKCRRFYGDDERSARWCCATDMPCTTDGCKGRSDKGWAYCKSCRDKKDKEAWLKLPEVPWDGTTPLTLHDDDVYFFAPEDLDTYIDDHEGMKAEDLMLVICEPSDKPRFAMDDLMCDYLSDDVDIDDPTDINKAVNEWIADHVPIMWEAGRERPTMDSVKESSR